ncbi:MULTISPECIES: 3-hydroxyacyl-CoA dehydrogenase NAD-binding domain-containing protein [Nocardia]|uniref:3-hydroxyacyl-CoA dehydrogenase/enoyl-CoA hydratase/3-hydroxybutyryl-CoA epimerase n=1 Tax=Nocardia ignorata TaxID=145285 RepID=A0A4R6P4I1_NOCIG|nr:MULTISPECIES: 3-hydroxyacyl-CoA dehydrogenase NAD-binding domain-containing protein [Nocardia]MCA2209194.1 enoyl-CoA hydratase/isomerase family protein [Nocardia rosealba]TDP32275.1 3-hydroxyacyl-CoA dehydrogenase/enoyl-CoA hydratase/3-hydroxybutyryl-CoA epimerase [Nocardia ignorata]
MTDNIIGWEKDADGVVVLTIDDPSQGANTMNDAYITSMAATVDRLEAEKDDITGVVITSGKKTFFAGGDLKNMMQVGPDNAADVAKMLDGVKAPLRRLEQLGKPVVAAINGAALGGGLEIALATHHRIAADVKGSAIGLPEVSLGLLPGGGGVTRTVRMLGLQNALMQVLLQGQRHRVTKAKEIGLIDEVVSSVEELLPAAKAWIAANPEAAQPWDKKGYKIPGGTPSTPALAANLPAFPANLRKQIKGTNMPAPRAIMAAAVEGAQVDIDNALAIEGRYFISLLTGPVAKNMIQAFFFDLNHINGGGSRPKDVPKREIKKIGVIGAGMMGAGIAYVSAKAGYEVVLKDVELANAEKGKAYSEAIEKKALSRGKTTQEKSDALLARITPTADAADFKGVDFVIEAVFENPDLKNKVFQEIEDIVDPDALLGSNTSTLPITLLSEGVKRSEDFIGIHFFSPVDKMPLVEIIKGENTSDEALARVYDYTLAIKKTPIVVNDSRGFFTSRVIGTFINEAISMVAEGVDPSTVEQAGLQAGYPAAPLKLSDELNFTTMQKIYKETADAIKAAGGELNAAAETTAAVLDKLVGEFDRKGKAGGAGFYDYVDGKAVGLWSELRSLYNSQRELPEGVTFQDLKDRMMFAEAIETQKCFDEGVLTSTADANIGSIFGIGFPAWSGGSHQFIVGYPGGQEAFVARADELAKKFGPRFEVPASLRK